MLWTKWWNFLPMMRIPWQLMGWLQHAVGRSFWSTFVPKLTCQRLQRLVGYFAPFPMCPGGHHRRKLQEESAITAWLARRMMGLGGEDFPMRTCQRLLLGQKLATKCCHGVLPRQFWRVLWWPQQRRLSFWPQTCGTTCTLGHWSIGWHVPLSQPLKGWLRGLRCQLNHASTFSPPSSRSFALSSASPRTWMKSLGQPWAGHMGGFVQLVCGQKAQSPHTSWSFWNGIVTGMSLEKLMMKWCYRSTFGCKIWVWFISYLVAFFNYNFEMFNCGWGSPILKSHFHLLSDCLVLPKF